MLFGEYINFETSKQVTFTVLQIGKVLFNGFLLFYSAFLSYEACSSVQNSKGVQRNGQRKVGELLALTIK